jgi:DNA polymerase III delta subunit
MASPNQLLESISKGKFRPVYYFFGAEDFRRTEAEKYVADHFLPDMQRATNYHRIDSKRISAGELMANLSNLPMLGEKEVFIIGSFESFKPKEIEQILRLLKSDDPNRVVILSTPSSKSPSKKSEFFKLMSDVAETVEFPRFRSDETQKFIRSRLAKNKISISSDALDLLTGLVSGDRGGLESEVNKLIDFKGAGEISVADIKNICVGYELYGIFELADIIIQGKTQRTLRAIISLLGAGTNVDTLIVLLQQHFLSLFLVKNGKAPVGNRGFLTWKFRQQAETYSNPQLEKIIITLADANAEVRHQRLPQNLVLEMLALNLSSQN